MEDSFLSLMISAKCSSTKYVGKLGWIRKAIVALPRWWGSDGTCVSYREGYEAHCVHPHPVLVMMAGFFGDTGENQMEFILSNSQTSPSVIEADLADETKRESTACSIVLQHAHAAQSHSAEETELAQVVLATLTPCQVRPV